MPAMRQRPLGFEFDRITAMVAALVVVGLAVYLLIRNQPITDPRLFFILRVIVSFAAAVLGATIPGFLDIRWSGGGLVVRAGGALALFLLTFAYTPDLVSDRNTGAIRQESHGVNSPNINDNKGNVIINGGGGQK